MINLTILPTHPIIETLSNYKVHLLMIEFGIILILFLLSRKKRSQV